jgi:hypothetical protein
VRALPAGTIALIELAPDQEAALQLHPRLWLEPSGSLCDRVTGRELLKRGKTRESFAGMELERLRPDFYRVRLGEKAVYLRFKHRRWYYHVEEHHVIR